MDVTQTFIAAGGAAGRRLSARPLARLAITAATAGRVPATFSAIRDGPARQCQVPVVARSQPLLAGPAAGRVVLELPGGAHPVVPG
jgi:hypothetical protein